MIALRGVVVDAEKVIRDGAVLIDGSIIFKVIQSDEIGDYDVEVVYGGKGYVIIPGLINAHTHVAMSKFRGIGEDMPTEKWLKEVVWPIELEWNPGEIRKWALIGIAEALSNGSTTINDHYFFAGEIAKAAEKVGIRAFVGQTVMDLVDFPLARPEDGFRFFKRWEGKSKLVEPVLAPHATNTVSLELMREIGEFARRKNALIHVHLAQSRAEVREVKERYGLTPVGYLRESGVLGEGLIGVHGVYLGEGEIKAYAESKAALVHCPTSNVKLEGRTVSLRGLIDLGANVAIGNDSPNPTGILDPFLEMRSAGIVANLVAGRAHAVPAREIFKMATLGGARALGLKAGLMRSGYLADLTLINARKPWSVPTTDPYSILVYSTGGRDVELVMVNGEIVYRNGTFVKLGKSVEDMIGEMFEANDTAGFSTSIDRGRNGKSFKTYP